MCLIFEQIVLLQGTPTTGKLRKMGKDYQKDKNKKRLFLIINATKFASGNNEALLGVIRITGYLGKKLIWIWDIWGENCRDEGYLENRTGIIVI